jgi:hypothetical protein
MKSTIKFCLAMALASAFTLSALMPSYAQSRLSTLSGNFLTQVARGSYRCNANASNTHRMRVRPGQYVCVQIDGDDDTDLDLFVYDPAGREVGRDISVDDEEEVCFTARRGGTYTIRVTNLGNVWNQYSLAF